MEAIFNQIESLLDDGYSLDSSNFCIMKNETPITNFIPAVLSVEDLDDGKDISRNYAIGFFFKGGKVQGVQVADKSFDKQAFYPTGAVFNRSKKNVTDLIRKQILYTEPKHIYCPSNGWNRIEDNYFYILGQNVCGLCESDVRIDQKSPVIGTSTDTPYQNACYLWKLASLSENVCPMLLLGTVAGLLSELLHQAGFSPLVIYLYGESSSFKTTTAALLTAVHGSKANMVSLASSPSSIRKFVVDHKDIPVVVDDMNKSDRKSIMSRNEEIISNLCQTIVDSGKLILRRGKDTHEMVFRNTAIITAEYLLKNISTRNRVIELPMEIIAPEKLQECQHLEKAHKTMETFALHFTTFISNNSGEAINRLCADFNNIQNDIQAPHSNSSYRINHNMRLLNSVAHILEWYFKEEVKLPQEYLGNWANIFYESIHTVCSDQIHELAKTEYNFEDTKYIVALYRGLLSHYLKDQPENEDHFLKITRRFNTGRPKKHDIYPVGFFYDAEKSIFCMTGDEMLRLVSFQYISATKKAISSQLAAFSIISKNSEGKFSFALPGNNSRYYNIHINDLMRIGEELYNKFQKGGILDV